MGLKESLILLTMGEVALGAVGQVILKVEEILQIYIRNGGCISFKVFLQGNTILQGTSVNKLL